MRNVFLSRAAVLVFLSAPAAPSTLAATPLPPGGSGLPGFVTCGLPVACGRSASAGPGSCRATPSRLAVGASLGITDVQGALLPGETWQRSTHSRNAVSAS